MNGRFQVFTIGERSRSEDGIAGIVNNAGIDAIHLPDFAACSGYMAGQRSALPGLVVSNPSHPDLKVLESLEALRRSHPHLVCAMAGCSFEPQLVAAAAETGVILLRKPIDERDIGGFIRRVRLNVLPLKAPVSSGVYIKELKDDAFFMAISPSMREIHSQVSSLASANVPVLITGETGVGKEIVARLIHEHSSRAHRPMLKVNCAALPNELLESELFGHEAGAFTGATKLKPGKFELCDRGTILLDEIGEMSPRMQAKLLQVLQEGEFSRLGSRTSTRVDARVIAATNIDVEKGIENGTFRQDLYYRLSAFVLHIPPLRERRQAVPYFLHEMSQRLAKTLGVKPMPITARLVAAAVQYNWPGNLRELSNFVKRYLILRDEVIAVVELESHIMRQVSIGPPLAPDYVSTLPVQPSGLKNVVRNMKDAAETEMIREVLRQNRGNRRLAADQLQISYKAILYKIRKYQLDAVESAAGVGSTSG